MEKKSHFGYYNIELTHEGEENYFIEFFSTQKKPKEWGEVEVCIFDAWHDDLIYSVRSQSDYLWVRVKSKFGIGSISFIPVGSDKSEKDFSVVHQYVTKKEMNPAIAVLVYPNTEERIGKVKKHLISLKKTGIPVYLCSNMECPEDLIQLCDGYVYTGPNEMCTVPGEIENKIEYIKRSIKNPIIIYPEKFEFYHGHSFINGGGTYLWAAAKCIRDSVHFLKREGFTHLMLSEGEFILDDLDSKKPFKILLDMWKNEISLDFFYTPRSRYLQAYLWFGEIDHIEKSFRDLSIEEKHFPRGEENSNSSAFVLCEKYYLQKLVSSDPSRKIRIRTVKENKELLEKKYWYTGRSEIRVHDESEFAKEGEKLSFPLYFPNTSEIFLSLQGENSKSDELNSKSFDLDFYRPNDKKWITIVKNCTISRELKFKITFFGESDQVLLEQEIETPPPDKPFDIWYFSSFETDEKITRCEYFVSRGEEISHFYGNILHF
jgi:hypothetical protein